MRIGVFQDIHANLPALKKGLEVFEQYGCTKIYHVGDLIGIGPYPKEVFELATSIQHMHFIMGNHDHWFAFGLPNPIPAYMNEEEVQHHEWTHQQIGEENRVRAQPWKFVEKLELENGKVITFQHYGIDENKKWFKPFVKTPNLKEITQLFDDSKSDFVFYGHHHDPSDLSGPGRYVNLGSAGCFNKPEVRLGILDIKVDGVVLIKLSVPYADNGLMEEYERRNVPAREFITKAFLQRD